MSAGEECDYLRRIPALAYGELEDDEVEEIREHVKSCVACESALRDFATVRDLLRSRPARTPLEPIWPRLRGQLQPSAKPHPSPIFALGTGLAVAAGIAIGIIVGSMTQQVEEESYQDIWSAVGSSITQETQHGLPSVYLATSEEKGN